MSDKPTAFAEYAAGPPVPGAVRVDSTVKAVSRILLANPMPGRATASGIRKGISSDPSSTLRRISNRTTSRIVDARNAMKLLPEIELAMNILVSSILSPKDLNTIELTFSQRNKVVRSDVATKMLEIIRVHFESHHKLKEQLTPMLEDVLFKTGSYPMLILAENTIDYLINGPEAVTMESLSGFLERPATGSSSRHFAHLGYLGNFSFEGSGEDESFGLEGFANFKPTSYSPAAALLPNVTILDNPNVLKLPQIRARMRADLAKKKLEAVHLRPKLSTESASTEADALIRSLYKNPNYKMEHNINIPTTGAVDRATIGHPTVIKLPSESVIPVHEPSNPSKHLGYFIILENGTPVNTASRLDYLGEINALYRNNESMISATLRDAARINNGYPREGTNIDARDLERIYGDLVEYELNQRLKRGAYGAGATVARPEEVYRVMLYRALLGKRTQLLYVPEEMLTYVAFDYDEAGIGISLLQKSIALAAQLANLTVSATLTEMKNAVSRTRLSITLDEEDPDPSGTVEHIVTEHVKLRRGNYPMTVFPPNDIANIIQQAAIEIEVNGNTGYPGTKLDVTDFSSNKVVPNDTLMKSMRDRLIWSFGLPPEVIDTSRGADFAVSVVNNHLLLTKSVMHHQQTLTPFIEKYVRAYVLSDGILLNELRQCLEESTRDPAVDGIEATRATAKDKIGGSNGNNFDRLIVDFLNDLQADLPKPEGAKLDNLVKAYTDHKQFLTQAVDEWLSEAALGGDLIGAEMAGSIEKAKAALVARWMRNWMRENGMSDPFDELLDIGESGAPGLDLLAEVLAHSDPIRMNLRDFLIKNTRRAAADEAVLERVKEQTGSDMGDPSSGSFSDATSDDNAGDEFGGDLDVDMGDTDSNSDDVSTELSGSNTTEQSESTTTQTNADGSTTTTSSSSSNSSTSSEQ